MKDCRVCGGDGYVDEPWYNTANLQMTTVCPACKGSGKDRSRSLPKTHSGQQAQDR